MNQIITKKELEEMISKNIDYDYEIFQKICDVVGKGKRKRCQEPFLGLPLFLSVISKSNFFKTLAVQLLLP